MNSYLWRNLILLIPSFIAMIYGIVKVYPKTSGIYFRMGTLGVACLFSGYLSSLVTHLTDVTSSGIIDVSILGNIGFSLFLLTQNADSLSSVMYEKKKMKSTNVLVAFMVSVFIIAMFIILVIKNYAFSVYGISFNSIMTLCILGCGAILNAVTSFYTVSYSFPISSDTDAGLIKYLVPYNTVMSILLVLLVPERFVRNITVTTVAGFALMLAYYILLAVCILIVIPLMERGRSKFLTSL